MREDRAGFRWFNLYVSIAIVLGLLAVILIVLPNFVGPRLVRRQMTLRLAAETTAPATPVPGRPTPSPTPTSLPPSDAGCRRYTVQAGDTLFGLARRFGTTETAIALANDLHNDILLVGQVLVICGPGGTTPVPVPASPTPVVPASPTPAGEARLGRPVTALISLTYPAALHNRKPQWITLSVSEPAALGAAEAGWLPDVVEATTLEPVTLPVPARPRLPRDRTASLVEHWLSAQLTGSRITLRSQPSQGDRALSELLATREALTWQWLFTPGTAGDYLFGLDLFSSGEFELTGADEQLAGSVRTEARPVWSHEFSVSVDEIFGIPRRWWIVAAGLGTLVNLVAGLLQIADAAGIGHQPEPDRPSG